ncbi:threonine--tRNA ligase [candidate division GN15 bacterium]|uniref:Threonine--tRNA ligase n=1 Tax=candidate division GN15 bacterium TaxID=2072418 RepID=A0A855X226_9BACT|nr:MAG: threonine--tRNA ligase [candidate division GN15 bacterium]
MSQVQITFPDGSARPFPSGVTGMQVAESISPRLAKEAIAVKVNGVVRDLNLPVTNDASIELLTFDAPQGKEVFWHSSSHIMAQAVQELFPGVKLAIGPPIEEGWYYDFEVPEPFSPEDLERIEKKMAEIVAEDAPFRCEVKKRADSISYYKGKGATYKVELLEGIEDDTVTFYYDSRFEDLCRGPHIPRTGIVKAFKLTSTSGAYWRGDETKARLQRIYGISFPKASMLDEYLKRLEEAKKRDHRLLGKQLELYHISEEVGPGLVLWLPRGARVRNEIENFWREEHLKFGYDLVYSPHIANLDLWHRSGHTGFYAENMYSPMDVDERKYQIKPMNCPFHIQMYRSRLWSYRDLPLRWAELGTVYRYERAGVLHGLMRVRGFTQDDAHHFVTPEGMEEELVWLIRFCVHILKSFGFTDYAVYLSTRPKDAIGNPEDWERAEAGLRRAMEIVGLKYQVDEGGGAFYGPKIDIGIKDALGRPWQCSTIQFDFNLPERFDLSFAASDGQHKRPLMIHRALLGSIERFFGVLVEHYAGNFPLWLAPVQVRLLPITDAVNAFASAVTEKLKAGGIRAELDARSEKIGAKIRDAELMKVPYMFVVGGREAEKDAVSVRRHGVGDLGVKSVDEAMKLLQDEIAGKGLSKNEK